MLFQRHPRNDLILGVVFLGGGLSLSIHAFLTHNVLEAFLGGVLLMSGLGCLEVLRLHRKICAMSETAVRAPTTRDN
jgi:uncharacterized membrane protein HdeD (DUF308 family)